MSGFWTGCGFAPAAGEDIWWKEFMVRRAAGGGGGGGGRGGDGGETGRCERVPAAWTREAVEVRAGWVELG